MVMLSATKLRRLKVGVKQWELARKVGIAETLFSKYECGREPIPPQVMRKIDRILTKYEVAATGGSSE